MRCALRLTKGISMTINIPLAIALSLIAVVSQAQERIDHSTHSGHDQMKPSTGHGEMEQGDNSHGSNSNAPHPHGSSSHLSRHPIAIGIPPGEAIRSPIPTLTEADRAAAFTDQPKHQMHQGGTRFFFIADEVEWQDSDAGDTLAWELNGWFGGDIDRLAFRSEGERSNGHTEEAELQLLWSHAIGPWWETVVGVRQDFEPGAPQTWGTVGVQGMPLYGLETEATAFLGEGGQSALRLEAEYDILLNQHWVLQPKAEINIHGRNDERRGVGSGLSDAGAGLRLRYEINRAFAPYVGVTWVRRYANTADMARSDDEDVSETRLVAGVRFWF